MMRALWIGVGVGLLSSACSSAPGGSTATYPPGTTGTGRYEGNIDGFSLDVADVAAVYDAPRAQVDPAPGQAYGSLLKVWLTDTKGACADRASNIQHKDSRQLYVKLHLFGATQAEAALQAGTYDLSPNTAADYRRIALEHYDAACAPDFFPDIVNVDAATSVGHVVIDSVSSTRVTGRYEIRRDGQYIAGSFDTAFCTASNSKGNSTCE